MLTVRCGLLVELSVCNLTLHVNHPFKVDTPHHDKQMDPSLWSSERPKVISDAIEGHQSSAISVAKKDTLGGTVERVSAVMGQHQWLQWYHLLGLRVPSLLWAACRVLSSSQKTGGD